MDFTLCLLFLTMFWKMSFSVRCYKCDPERVFDNKHIPLCEDFDGSEQFVTDCVYSTYCYKKETVLTSIGDITSSIERGCASQLLDGDQRKINTKWYPVKEVYDAYTEGCKQDSKEEDKATMTTHCYCKGDLCNGARGIAGNVGLFIGVIILLIGAV